MNLLASGVAENAQCMQGIGYKEVVDFIKNEQLQCTMSDIIKKNTRNYAKRQITFFKKLPELRYLPMDGTKEAFWAAVDAIIADYEVFEG
jgi:tRNA dimethylallyltransferase